MPPEPSGWKPDPPRCDLGARRNGRVTTAARQPSALGMKTKYTAVLSALVLGCAVALMAAEKRTPDTGPRLVLLKSNGITIAELKVLKGATLQMESHGPTSEM